MERKLGGRGNRNVGVIEFPRLTLTAAKDRLTNGLCAHKNFSKLRHYSNGTSDEGVTGVNR